MPELQGGSTYLNVEYVSNIEKKSPEKLDSDYNDDKEHDKDSDKNSDMSGKRLHDVDLFDDDDDMDNWANEPPSRKLKVDDDKEEALFDEVVSDHTIDDD